MPWSAQALHELCGSDELFFYDPTKAYVTVCWAFRRLIKCFVRGNGKSEWRKDSNMGGGGYGCLLHGPACAPLGKKLPWGPKPHSISCLTHKE